MDEANTTFAPYSDKDVVVIVDKPPMVSKLFGIDIKI